MPVNVQLKNKYFIDIDSDRNHDSWVSEMPRIQDILWKNIVM